MGVVREKLKERDKEELAVVEAEVQVPPIRPTFMPLLQLERKKFVTRGITKNLRFKHSAFYLSFEV